MSMLLVKNLSQVLMGDLCVELSAAEAKSIRFCSDRKTRPSVLANILQDGDLVQTQGAGDVGKVARHLAALELNIGRMQQI